jgi:segregation and condensation protein B
MPDASLTASQGPSVSPHDQAAVQAKVEAGLLVHERALSSGKLADALGVGAKAVDQAIAALNEHYEQTGRSFRIEAVAGGWRVMTLPEHADVLDALHNRGGDDKLSPSCLETLAIVAYKQPVMRAQVEAIRGSSSGDQLRTLMDHHLIKITGRAEEIGRPMLYGTTKRFLELFGLASLKDLPSVEQLSAGAG